MLSAVCWILIFKPASSHHATKLFGTSLPNVNMVWYRITIHVRNKVNCFMWVLYNDVLTLPKRLSTLYTNHTKNK